MTLHCVATIESEVPQGSILGLFILLVNDLYNTLQKSNLLMCADKTVKRLKKFRTPKFKGLPTG